MRHRGNIPSKITPPGAYGTYPRKRLFSLLDSGKGRGCVWVCAPPGAGKTTLVAGYLKLRKLPCVWYQVDGGDNDPATFFHYLDLAAGAASGKKTGLARFTPENMQGLREFSKNWFRRFFEAIPGPAAVVFDNFHEASSCDFYLAMAECMGAAPAGKRVIVISRSLPPPAFARASLHGEMKFIGWGDLKLSLSEARFLAKALGHKGTPEGVLKTLHGSSEGWLAGLLLMLEGAGAGRLSGYGSAGGAQAVFDYFMSEIFEKTGSHAREFLLRTAYLPDMTVQMAMKASGRKDARKILRELVSRHFFTESLGAGEEAYRYHPLFREFLKSRATEAFRDPELRRLKSLSADILEEAGLFEEAARVLIDARDWKKLKLIILRNSSSLLEEGRAALLGSWLKAMPAEEVENDGWLLYYRGTCLLQADTLEARKCLEGAYGAFKARDDAAGLYLCWSGIADSYLFEWKDMRPLDKWIREFERLRKRHERFPSVEAGERATACIFSALLLRQPQSPALKTWAQGARSLMQASVDIQRRMHTGYNLIIYYLWTGQNAKAEALIDEHSKEFCCFPETSVPQLLWRFSEALYYFHSGSYGETLKALEAGLKAAADSGIHIVDSILYGLAMMASVQDRERRHDYVEKWRAASSRRRSYFDEIFYHHQHSILSLKARNLPAAVEHASLSLKFATDAGAPFLEAIMECALNYLLVESGATEGANGKIAEARGLGGSLDSSLIEYLCLITEAVLHLRLGQGKPALETFEKALRLGKESSIRFIYLFNGASIAELCAIALGAGFSSDYMKELIETNNLPPAPEHDIEEWPWAIRIYTLGRFEIFKGGKRIEFKRKAQHRPLELLSALISMGGANVPETRFTDALWPDSEGDMAHQAFATTLHRLRKLLGADKALIYRDGRLTLDWRYAWVDSRRFENLVRRAEAASKGAAGGAARYEDIRLLEKAAALYQGGFLPAVTGEHWAATVRERLRGKYVRVIMKLARRLEESGDLEGAIDCYLKGIEHDELAEQLCRGLMMCYRRTGQRSEAIKVYRRLEAALASALKAEPSKETRSIYESILSN